MHDTNSLDVQSLELFKGTADCLAVAPRATFQPKTGWSDSDCTTLYSRPIFPVACKSASTQRAILIRFLNFHCKGEVAPGFSAFDIVSAMIATMPGERAVKASETMYLDMEYSDDEPVFTLAPLPAIGEESLAGSSAAKPLDIVTSYSPLSKIDDDPEVTAGGLPGTGAYKVSPVERVIHSYSSSECDSFLKTATLTVENSPASDAPGQAMITLRRVCGYIALTMLRFLIKDRNQMALAFSKSQYKRNLLSLVYKTAVEGAYSPPCQLALTKAEDAFLRSHLGPRVLFAKVLLEWRRSTVTGDKWKSSIIAAACLTHTAYNGMHMLHMLNEVSTHFSIDWGIIGENLFFTNTAKSWRRITDFQKTYFKIKDLQYLYPWARVIDDAYFSEFAAKDNFVLSVILASILEQVSDNAGIWDAKWVQGRLAECEDLKYIGKAFCRKFSANLPDMKGNTASNKMLEEAKILRAQGAPSILKPVTRDLQDSEI